jgi:hypothetical protein
MLSRRQTRTAQSIAGPPRKHGTRALAAGEGHQPINLLPLVPLMVEESGKHVSK